ncbi:MAG TPA: site-2 protease family protein [Thermoplasmata archaeon]|jgi:Zn-dependent protease
MRPPYSEYAAPPIYVYPAPPKRGVHFSRTELTQLGIAILGLSAALTVLYVVWGNGLRILGSPLTSVGFVFASSLVSVGSGVGLHEIMHKVVAQRYGHWAEFRYSLQGLAMAFIFAFLGFIFGAPGATYISGAVTKEQNGRISAAGPVTNVVLGLAFIGLYAVVLPIQGMAAALAGAVFQSAAFMNLVLAGFNMIPVMPLDGAKVWRWNLGAWIGILAVVIGIFVLGMNANLLFL